MNINLAYSLNFPDLYSHNGLEKLDQIFLNELGEVNPTLFSKITSARTNPTNLTRKEYSNLITELAPYLEDFLATLFNITHAVSELTSSHFEFATIYNCKRLFIQRRALKAYTASDAAAFVTEEIIGAMVKLIPNFTEEILAKAIMQWLDRGEEDKLEQAAKYAAWAVYTPEGQHLHQNSILFHFPEKVDFNNLVELQKESHHDQFISFTAPAEKLRNRTGFRLTDAGPSFKRALDQAHYCIHCHNQNKDSCSTGMKDSSQQFKLNPLAIPLTGCPLEEKISEMNLLKSTGHFIGALAAAIIDNPMLAATGHRICNDCTKSCIYQKQEPVDIPQIETSVLQDVLSLPWGFEIYSLLTRWNPLNIITPKPKLPTGYKVLVAGLGPAGFTLAHHLLNDGHTVIGIDGLKIEPLPSYISGRTIQGEQVPFEPIKNVSKLFEDLSTRVSGGFGGVLEYGITVRWNKNYLKLIRLLLERRENFAMYGGVRFGGSINYNNAFSLGFDHIALALGAGAPNLPSIENIVARGIRTSSDFLMNLQLGGAAREDSIANLQIRLPIIIIGGGLTAIDTATEALAYYPIQVEKFLKRYEILVNELGEQEVRGNWNEEEKIIAEEFIAHATSLRKEQSNKIALIKSWGGAKIVYRSSIENSPSYRLNHEEVTLAMQEGIEFIENVTPQKILLDDYGHVNILEALTSDQQVIQLKARAILLATGTSPNIVLTKEDQEHFYTDKKYFQALDEEGKPISPEKSAKPKEIAIIHRINSQNKAVSFFGDLHPSFSGNVVKAMASAKRGYPIVTRTLAKATPLSNLSSQQFIAQMNGLLLATVKQVLRLSSNIVEIIVHSPLAARTFHPGQFYRIQNYENLATKITGAHLVMEGVALTGASVDKDAGLISLIALEMGGSSDLCELLKEGEPIILMGPTGTPTEIVGGETVMLVGGGLGNAVLFSIGKAFREAGSKIIYFAGYKRVEDRYKIKEIEEAADYIIWSCEETILPSTRIQDKSVQGNIIQSIISYAKGTLGTPPLPLQSINRMIVIGSDRMMDAVNRARVAELAPYLNSHYQAFASINSPMQCMMKEICAQCLQRHIDPNTGQEVYVYSCSNQDQPMELVDFTHLQARLKQNSLQEKVTALWTRRAKSKLFSTT